MSSALIRRLPKPSQKPYIPPAMTIVAGFRCKDGLVLCADRQVSVPGAFKYFEPKISVEKVPMGNVAIAFSGEPGFAREIREKLMMAIRPLQNIDIGELKSVLDDVLSNFTRLYTHGDNPLQLLIALTQWLDPPELLKFDGRALHKADDFNCIGVGNSPLIRFLSDTLYTPDINVETGVMLAAYLIHKAEQYIDWCGGQIDVVAMYESDEDCDFVSQQVITEAIEHMNERERQSLPKSIFGLPF